MIIPKYWAQAKTVVCINERKLKLQRFGWSDESEADAKNSAQQRVDEAAKLALQGVQVRRIDRKIAYNGADGLPIREEIIRTYNDVILTRNSYGALCLNTPDVVFADVDVYESHIGSQLTFITCVLFVVALVLGNVSGYFLEVILAYLVLSVVPCALFFLLKKFASRFIPTPAEKALKKIRAFAAKNTDWRLRIYRTPNGFRVMVMHACFQADDPKVNSFFIAIGTDPQYIAMCNNQKCFRARVSPKPWRMSMPRPASGVGVWPVATQYMQERKRWVGEYENTARKFASCVYVESIGANRLDRKVERVRAIHDELSQAARSYPLA